MVTKFRLKADDLKVCVFCDTRAVLDYIGESVVQICPQCDGYKGLMTIEEWEDYTGEEWEDG